MSFYVSKYIFYSINNNKIRKIVCATVGAKYLHKNIPKYICKKIYIKYLIIKYILEYVYILFWKYIKNKKIKKASASKNPSDFFEIFFP